MSNSETGLSPLLGISLGGPAPLGLIDLRLDQGLSVLYGLNGVGKSTVIRALERALSGRYVSDNTWLHFQFSPESMNEVDIDSIDGQILHPVKDVLTQSIRGEFGNDPMELNTKFLSVLQCETELLLADAFESDRVIAEIVSQRYLSFRPIGKYEPEWEVWISAKTSDDTPCLQFSFESSVRKSDLLSQDFEDGDAKVLAIYEFHELESELAKERGVERTSWKGPDIFEWRKRDPIFPIPLHKFGPMRLGATFTLSLGDDKGERLTNLSRQVLREVGTLVDVVSETEVVPSTSAQQLLDRMSRSADQELEKIFGDDAPVLNCRLQPWGASDILNWSVSDRYSSSEIDIGSLGSGRSRWATMSAQLAVTIIGRDISASPKEGYPYFSDRVVLVDEPELGLHPVAENKMFSGLKDWAQSRTVVVATHSPVPFRDIEVELVHVDRDHEGLIVCRRMEPQIQALLQTRDKNQFGHTSMRLGLDPSEILQLCRQFLVVEGAHDKAVIEAVLGIDELAKSRTLVLPMLGTHNLMTVLDSQLLLDFTSASVLVVLDRTNGPKFARVWEQAKELYKSRGLDEALLSLRSLKSSTAEEQSLRLLCERALKSNRYERLRIFGLSKPDIINYLPVSAFIPGAESWDSVFEKRDKSRPFKEYLRSQGAEISAVRLGKMAKDLDYLHDDFIELRQWCFSGR